MTVPQPPIVTAADLHQEATGEGYDPDKVWPDEPDTADGSEFDDHLDRHDSDAIVEE